MMRYSGTDSRSRRRIAVTVRGVVQGIGMRPFVYQAARTRGLAGWVQNEADTLRIEVAGGPAAVAAFLEALEHDAPRQARIDSIDVAELPAGEARGPAAGPAFEIRASRQGGPRRRSFPPTWPPVPTAWPRSTTRPSAATATRLPTAPPAARAGRSSASCPTTGRERR